LLDARQLSILLGQKAPTDNGIDEMFKIEDEFCRVLVREHLYEACEAIETCSAQEHAVIARIILDAVARLDHVAIGDNGWSCEAKCLATKPRLTRGTFTSAATARATEAHIWFTSHVQDPVPLLEGKATGAPQAIATHQRGLARRFA